MYLAASLDAALQQVLGFQLRKLARDKAEHDRFVVSGTRRNRINDVPARAVS